MVDFYVLILYPTTLLNSFIISRGFIFISLEMFYIDNYITETRTLLFFPFQSVSLSFLLPFLFLIFFCFLTALTRISGIMLYMSGVCGDFVLFLILGERFQSSSVLKFLYIYFWQIKMYVYKCMWHFDVWIHCKTIPTDELIYPSPLIVTFFSFWFVVRILKIHCLSKF